MIKQKFINNTIELIKGYYPTYNENDLIKLKYGLEGIYLTISKLIILILFAFILRIEKEVLLLVLSFSIIRSAASGVHASKSWICLLTTLLIFLTVPLIFKYYILSFYNKLFIGLICLLLFTKYAPADTKKRPLKIMKKKHVLKIITIIIAITFIIISLYAKNNLLVNSLTGALIIETLMILPITYKIYNQPYRNYKKGL